MGRLAAKFAKWLDKHYPEDQHGAQSQLARDIGKDQSRINRWRKARKRDPDAVLPNVTLENLERLASAQTPEIEPWRLLREVERGRLDRRGGRVTSITDRERRAWESLFRGNPVRAKRVLMNLRHQEALGYTDLISEVVRLIIEMGPEKAALKVATLLEKHREDRSSHRTKLRRQMAEEYADLD